MTGTDMTTRILKLYEALSRGKEIFKLSFCAEYGVSERTFERDIEKIRLFLSEEYSGKEVEYNPQRACYRIPGINEGGSLSEIEIMIIVKILKGEGALEKNEFQGLMQNLQKVSEPGKKIEIKRLIKEESSQYEEQGEHDAFLKLFGDLHKCIIERNIIRLKMKGNQDNKTRFFPVAVEYMDSEFYLLGYKPDSETELTVLRLKDIDYFQVSNPKYKEEIADQYSYQEGKRLLENIQKRRKENE